MKKKLKLKKIFATGQGFREPRMVMTFLPRCGNCEAPHPMARNPPIDADTCPDCGSSIAQPGTPVEVPALLTGFNPAILLARAFFAFAKYLKTLSERL